MFAHDYTPVVVNGGTEDIDKNSILQMAKEKINCST